MPNGTLNSYLLREDLTLTTMDKLHIVSTTYAARYNTLPFFHKLKQITEGLKYRK